MSNYKKKVRQVARDQAGINLFTMKVAEITAGGGIWWIITFMILIAVLLGLLGYMGYLVAFPPVIPTPVPMTP